MLIIAAIACSYILAVLIVVRAVEGRFVSEFPLVYSYLIFLLVTSTIINIADVLGSRFFLTIFWLRFFTLVVAEFALLLEIGDHIFRPYPAIRQLGRLITLGITLVFSALFILPSLWETRPSNVAILDLMKRSALTKGVIIVALVAVARYCGIRLGRNVTGLIVGLATYLGIHTANFAIAESYRGELYGPIFSAVGTLNQTLCLLIWTVALWRLEPVLAPIQAIAASSGGISEPLPDRLGRLNTTLGRFFRK